MILLPIFTRVFNIFMAIAMTVTGLVFTGQLPPRMPVPETGPFTQHVNPFIGTGSFLWASGFTNPGATAPFGTVQLGPDTTWAYGINSDRIGTGGYYYYKTHTFGFSHTRISGAGIVLGGLFRITPAGPRANPMRRLQRPLLFSHSHEVAAPGYYAVWLPEIAVMAEMTATERTGVHRYTFRQNRDARLFLDATSCLRNSVREGRITVVDEYTVEGYTVDLAFFRAEFSHPFEAAGWAGDGTVTATEAQGHAEAFGFDVGLDLNFGRLDEPLTVWLGFSYVSLEGARANLAAESAGVPFDEVYESTRDNWDERLGSIVIDARCDDIMAIFYSSLYRSMIHPTNFTDVTGEFAGFGREIGVADGFTYRNDLSLWDTFRSTHSLYSLIAPDIQHDSVQSLLRMAEAHGGFPRWPRMFGDGGSMFGTPAHIVIAEAYLKGLVSDEDAAAALGFMRDTVMGTTPDTFPFSPGRDYYNYFNELGFVPQCTGRISVSRTLEYAWADWAAANMAYAMGPAFAEDEAMFRAKGYHHMNTWCERTRYFAPRNTQGDWLPFSPYMTDYYEMLTFTRLSYAFSEGSARHYRWHAVQNPQWLVEAMGGKRAFVRETERFMRDASRLRGAPDPGSGWWVGNQHNYHVPYMFNEAGRPDLTQRWVRWTLEDRFANTPDGIDGNDDLGALSAWYVLSALGFFPVVGSDRYWLGSPIVDSATLTLPGGYELNIIAHNQSARNVYVTSVTFNGEPIEGNCFTHDMIAQGGTMEFQMSRRPG